MGIIHKTKKKLAKRRLKKTKKRAQKKKEIADIYGDILKEQKQITKAEKTISKTKKERGPLISPETKKRLKEGFNTFQDWAEAYDDNQKTQHKNIYGGSRAELPGMYNPTDYTPSRSSKSKRSKRKREKEWWEL